MSLQHNSYIHHELSNPDDGLIKHRSVRYYLPSNDEITGSHFYTHKSGLGWNLHMKDVDDIKTYLGEDSDDSEVESVENVEEDIKASDSLKMKELMQAISSAPKELKDIPIDLKESDLRDAINEIEDDSVKQFLNGYVNNFQSFGSYLKQSFEKEYLKDATSENINRATKIIKDSIKVLKKLHKSVQILKNVLLKLFVQNQLGPRLTVLLLLLIEHQCPLQKQSRVPLPQLLENYIQFPHLYLKTYKRKKSLRL